MEITGTIQTPNGNYERISVQGETYDGARESLTKKIPDGHKLIAIRTNR